MLAVAEQRLLERVQAEYREDPGLDLTKPQMQRLFGCDRQLCDALVDALVAEHALRRTTRGTFVSERNSV